MKRRRTFIEKNVFNDRRFSLYRGFVEAGGRTYFTIKNQRNKKGTKTILLHKEYKSVQASKRDAPFLRKDLLGPPKGVGEEKDAFASLVIEFRLKKTVEGSFFVINGVLIFVLYCYIACLRS